MENSPANLCHHTKETLRESWKHMLESIQYILDYGKVDVNPKAAKFFNDLEKYVQKIQVRNTEVTTTGKSEDTSKRKI